MASTTKSEKKKKKISLFFTATFAYKYEQFAFKQCWQNSLKKKEENMEKTG